MTSKINNCSGSIEVQNMDLLRVSGFYTDITAGRKMWDQGIHRKNKDSQYRLQDAFLRLDATKSCKKYMTDHAFAQLGNHLLKLNLRVIDLTWLINNSRLASSRAETGLILACLQIAALDVRLRNLSYFKIQVSTHMAEIYSRAAVDVSKWSVFFQKQSIPLAGPLLVLIRVLWTAASSDAASISQHGHSSHGLMLSNLWDQWMLSGGREAIDPPPLTVCFIHHSPDHSSTRWHFHLDTHTHLSPFTLSYSSISASFLSSSIHISAAHGSSFPLPVHHPVIHHSSTPSWLWMCPRRPAQHYRCHHQEGGAGQRAAAAAAAATLSAKHQHPRMRVQTKTGIEMVFDA